MIIVEDVVRTIENRRKSPVALGIFAAMVAAASFGVVDILTAALAAAFLMLATGCLQPARGLRRHRRAGAGADHRHHRPGRGPDRHRRGRSLRQRLPLACSTGAGPHAVLAGLIVLTSVLSHFLSNNSTAVLLVPIALATAAALGVDPRPFVVGVCFGASACFATPIGYQTNLLVYGPGGYRFSDFTRLGMVLNVLVWVGASVFIPRMWPF